MDEHLFEMKDVTAGYAEDIDVLKTVCLNIYAGRISGVIGLNGAGKSTLVKTMCGFLPPKSGSISYLGQSTTGVPPHELVAQGLVCIPQESSLFPHLSVEDNLSLPLRIQKKNASVPIDDLLNDAYDKFPILKGKRREQAGDLSGGQQKQLEFAKAWIMRPRLCVIDEPSIGLSPNVADEIFMWINKFKEERIGVLLIDHNVRRVVQMSDRIHVLSLGEIAVTGESQDFEGDLYDQVRQWLGLDY